MSPGLSRWISSKLGECRPFASLVWPQVKWWLTGEFFQEMTQYLCSFQLVNFFLVT